MNTKQKILESLEGKRTEAIWELIEKAIKELYPEGDKADLSIAKEEYLEYEEQVNNLKNRFIIVEDYNIEEGFYHRFYEDNVNLKGEIPITNMFEDYFSDTEESTGFEAILLVDMKEMKCYLLDKEIKYHKKEVKIK